MSYKKCFTNGFFNDIDLVIILMGNIDMRMWLINPELLCKNHLLGEHSELHKHKHIFVKQYKIDKRILPIVQICPEQMEIRHNALAQEMLKRGYNHKSPYEQPDLSYLSNFQRYAIVDIIYNIKDLCKRCSECNERIKKFLTHAGFNDIIFYKMDV